MLPILQSCPMKVILLLWNYDDLLDLYIFHDRHIGTIGSCYSLSKDRKAHSKINSKVFKRCYDWSCKFERLSSLHEQWPAISTICTTLRGYV